MAIKISKKRQRCPRWLPLQAKEKYFCSFWPPMRFRQYLRLQLLMLLIWWEKKEISQAIYLFILGFSVSIIVILSFPDLISGVIIDISYCGCSLLTFTISMKHLLRIILVISVLIIIFTIISQSFLLKLHFFSTIFCFMVINYW